MSCFNELPTFVGILASKVDSLADTVIDAYKLTRQVILEYQAKTTLMKNCANCAWSVEEHTLGSEGYCQPPLTCISPSPCQDKSEWKEQPSFLDS